MGSGTSGREVVTCGLGGALKELVSSTIRPDTPACLFYRDSSEYTVSSMQRVVYFVGNHGLLSW